MSGALEDPAHASAGRVLMVCSGCADNGGTRSTCDLAADLRARGVDVELFSLRANDLNSFPHGIEPAGITSGGLRPGRRRELYRVPLMAVRLLRAARRCEIMVSSSEAPGALETLLAGKATRTPTLVTVRASPAPMIESYVHDRLQGATKRAYRHYDAAICVSHGLVPEVTAMGVPAERVRMIHNGVNVERVLTMAKAPPPSWLPGDQPLVVGVGRLWSEKGFDLLVRAHAQASAAGPAHRLVLLGDGPELEPLRRLASELGVSDTVLLPGGLENPFPTVTQASLVCVPSRHEGYGLAIAEALVLGVPVVATACTGPRDVLQAGRYGDLVDVGSIDALAGAMVRHLQQPERLRAKARAASRNSDSFSAARTAEAYVALFKDLLADRQRVTPPRQSFVSPRGP